MRVVLISNVLSSENAVYKHVVSDVISGTPFLGIHSSQIHMEFTHPFSAMGNLEKIKQPGTSKPVHIAAAFGVPIYIRVCVMYDCML